MRRLAVCLLLTTIAAPAQSAEPTEASFDQCFDQQVQRTPFSGIVSASNGRISFERATGFVDAEGQQHPSVGTPFRLASVQKVLTAIAIGRLVDQGKVALDAPISRYLDGLPPDLGQVTIDQLLHHQSGVANMTDLNPQIAQALGAAKSARDLVPLVVAQPLAFPPGSRTEYSNGGYFLLGAIIEAASRMSYADFLQTQLYEPLRMTSSGLAHGSNVAKPYSRFSPRGPLDAPRVIAHMDLPASSAGDGVSSASDMLALGRALVGDQLLSKPTKERIFRRRSDPWRIGQSGGAPGENTDFSAFPDNGWVVVVLSNFDPPAGELMGEVMRRIASGGTCQPLSPEDRPSPFKLILRPPPGAAHS